MKLPSKITILGDPIKVIEKPIAGNTFVGIVSAVYNSSHEILGEFPYDPKRMCGGIRQSANDTTVIISTRPDGKVICTTEIGSIK